MERRGDLQAVELKSIWISQRGKLREWNRAVAVIAIFAASGPGETDLELFPGSIDSCAPGFDDLGLGREIGNRGGDRIQCCVEHQGQAWQSTMQIELTERLSGWNDAFDAGEFLKQPNERWLTFQHDLSAHLGDRGDVADEMDRVSETLLSVKEDRFASEIFADPGGLGESSGREKIVADAAAIRIRASLAQDFR